MPDGQLVGGEQRAVLWTALGRQRVGKTTLLNMAAQFFRGRGVPLEVWNADQQNRSHSLSSFFIDAVVAPEGGLEDGKRWIEQRLVAQVQRRCHAVLDPGGGFTGFSSLVHEVPVIGQLDQHGIDVIGVFCVGPEKADIDYLDHFAQTESFLPQATVIVLNAGLVLSGRSAEGAFETVLAMPAVTAAVRRGARVVMMPALSCMAEVTDRGISFTDAAENRVRPGQAPMSLFDPVRVREWWTKKVPAFFDGFPPEWLPRAPASPAGMASEEADR